MTSAQKLEALIEKAVENGWAYWLHEGVATFEIRSPTDMLEPLVRVRLGKHSQQVNYQVNYQQIIFNHGFARALFGEEQIGDKYPMCEHRKVAWRHHLQKAVISDDPIRYMYWAVFEK